MSVLQTIWFIAAVVVVWVGGLGGFLALLGDWLLDLSGGFLIYMAFAMVWSAAVASGVYLVLT